MARSSARRRRDVETAALQALVARSMTTVALADALGVARGWLLVKLRSMQRRGEVTVTRAGGGTGGALLWLAAPRGSKQKGDAT